MLRENSPTLQRMISSVKPGDGNMNTAPVMAQGQFQSPYPSPKDMVMQAGMMPYQPMYRPFDPALHQYGYNSMTGFYGPNNTITMINGVPTELEYRPHEVGQNTMPVTTYREIPGAPVNPDLAHLTGQSVPVTPPPGRYMASPNTNPQFAQAKTNYLYQQPNIIGGYNPYYGGMSISQQPRMSSQSDHPDIYGTVDIYNGQMVHPHVKAEWYGSPDFPFNSSVKASMQQAGNQNVMRDVFNQKFPGYSNPYMTQGFMQQPQATISPEVQDMANIAAYYGMSYDQFIQNGSRIMKMLSRHANKYFDRSEEEISKREKLYDVKYPKQFKNVPDNDEDLFYPNGAFDFRGQFTREYQDLFCTSNRFKKVSKVLKVVVNKGDEKIECPKRIIDFISSRDQLDRWLNTDANYRNLLNYNRYRFSNQYWSAPERQLDHIEGNVFDVTTKSLAIAEQCELEAKLRYQCQTRSSTLFNRNDFITQIKAIREQAKASAKAIEQQKWNKLIHTVAGNTTGPQPNQQAPLYRDRPYICDGDWIIAKPGVDIVGLPLDQSVNKIIRMNTVTGEEEIYDPSKMMGLDVRERIKSSIQPSFNQIDDDELETRLEKFKQATFLTREDEERERGR